MYCKNDCILKTTTSTKFSKGKKLPRSDLRKAVILKMFRSNGVTAEECIGKILIL